MSAPAISVIMNFLPTSALGSYFVLDDATKGLLDGSTYKLAPTTVAVDVSAYLSGSISVNRGRSRETDQFPTGTATFTLRNEDRRFDPTYTAGPYYPAIIPRQQVQIKCAGNVIFTGLVDDFQPNYEKPSIATVDVSCSGTFSLLATTILNNFQTPSSSSTFVPGIGAIVEGSYTSSVMAAVLARPEVPTGIGLTTHQGASNWMTFQVQQFDKVSAADVLQSINNTEGGFTFEDVNGNVVMLSRTYITQQKAALPTGSVQFTDTGIAGGGPYGYMDISVISGHILLFNRVQALRNAGALTPEFDTPATQIADSATSQNQYKIRTLQLPNVETEDNADALTLANWKLQLYQNPEVRFDTLALELSGLSGADQAIMSALDLMTLAQVTRTPPGGGSAIVQLCAIEKIDWSFDVSNSTYKLGLGFMSLTAF